jgi:peptidoglycan hydrolase CwlO-like protein
MSDLGARAVDTSANTKTIEQTYALRGWLTALLAQTVQAETTIKYRIADLETEAGRLREHLEQTTAAIATLRRSIDTVDQAIGRRLRELHASAALERQSERAEAVAETRAEHSEQPARSQPHEGRRRHRPSG